MINGGCRLRISIRAAFFLFYFFSIPVSTSTKTVIMFLVMLTLRPGRAPTSATTSQHFQHDSGKTRITPISLLQYAHSLLQRSALGLFLMLLFMLFMLLQLQSVHCRLFSVHSTVNSKPPSNFPSHQTRFRASEIWKRIRSICFSECLHLPGPSQKPEVQWGDAFLLEQFWRSSCSWRTSAVRFRFRLGGANCFYFFFSVWITQQRRAIGSIHWSVSVKFDRGKNVC